MTWRNPTKALVVVLAGLLGLVSGQVSVGAEAPAAETTASAPPIIPVPVSEQVIPGQSFLLTADTRILVRGEAAGPIATYLAGLLRRSTGFGLPVSGESAGDGAPSITLDTSGPASLGQEGYRLEAVRGRVRLVAHTAQGLVPAVQTLRQLLPARIESRAVQPGPWTVPGVLIQDHPRFVWRGAMVDVSRHFFTVQQIERYIDLISMYKVNYLHLHLSDDQG